MFAIACDTQTHNPDVSNGVSLFLLPDIEGNDREVRTVAGGRTVLAFWATWCTPCRRELVELDSLYADFARRGLAIYAVSVDDATTVDDVGPWVAEAGYRFPVVLDTDHGILARYQPARQIPFVVVLDEDGRVVEQWQGYGRGEIDALRERLDQILAPD